MAKTKDVSSGGVAGCDVGMGRLQEIFNVGPRMAEDLLKRGIGRLEDAAGRNPDEMYHELCALDAKRHDPCVREVFAAVVSQAEGHPARPWWEFTRKERPAKRGPPEGRRREVRVRHSLRQDPERTAAFWERAFGQKTPFRDHETFRIALSRVTEERFPRASL